MIQSLKIALVLLVTASTVGCSTQTSAPTPPVAAESIPAEWAFLGVHPVEQVLTSSDTSFMALIAGDVETTLQTAVTTANAAGWTEARRRTVFDGTKVFFDGSDGSLLTLTVSPEGASVLVVSTIAPPE
ncbi:MAG: hypothetical protein ACJAZO_001706 [Myxococcota bacterium]|jgi:hypothetical protein